MVDSPVRHGVPSVGVVLEGGGVILGVEDIVGVEVRVADGSLQHCALHCTWGLVFDVIGGRPGLVRVSKYSFPASCLAMLSVDQSAIYHRSKEGTGESNLKNKAFRMTRGGDNRASIGTRCWYTVCSSHPSSVPLVPIEVMGSMKP